MTEEIKEISDYVNKFRYNKNIKEINPEDITTTDEIYKLVDYITNLQEENERLKANYKNDKSHQINYNYFKTLYSKADKDVIIDDLVYKCEDLDNLRQDYGKQNIKLSDYKSRCEKANEIITDFMCTEEYCNVDPVAIAENYMEIQKLLNGSDNNE